MIRQLQQQQDERMGAGQDNIPNVLPNGEETPRRGNKYMISFTLIWLIESEAYMKSLSGICYVKNFKLAWYFYNLSINLEVALLGIKLIC